MLKMHLAAGLAATALMTAAAVAQTTPPPATPATPPAVSAPMPAPSSSMPAPSTTAGAGAGSLMTQMPADQFRVSKLMGVDVYGSDNQKIGDIDELLVDRQGKTHGVVVGVGGFLGIGQKDVAIPFDQVTWMSSREVSAMNASSSTTTTAGGTTASTAPATTGSTAGSASEDMTPARATVKMTKADLQNATEFRYSNDARASTTTAPAARP